MSTSLASFVTLASIRLARYFGGSAAIWLRLQVAYDLSRAEAELASKIAAEVSPAAA
jgi:plasmid maintenance system antidote protein VapI